MLLLVSPFSSLILETVVPYLVAIPLNVSPLRTVWYDAELPDEPFDAAVVLPFDAVELLEEAVDTGPFPPL